MYNLLLLTDRGTEHYFSHKNSGIFLRKQRENGIFDSGEALWENSTGVFSAYFKGTVHLIFTDKNNSLVYAIRQNNQWKSYVLSRLPQGLNLLKMELFSLSGRLNLIFSAEYLDEIILVHCLLGNRARPRTLSTLLSPHFSVLGEFVYYTSQKGELCKIKISETDINCCEILNTFGENASAYLFKDCEMLIYSHKNRLFINNKEIIYDSRIETPVLFSSGGTLYAMWKSGGYVRYITRKSDNIWSNPMRFATSGAEIQLYTLVNGNSSRQLYGYNTTDSFRLFAKPDL